MFDPARRFAAGLLIFGDDCARLPGGVLRTGGMVMGYTVDKQEALRYLGYSGQRVEGDLVLRFETIVQAVEQTLRPAFIFEVFDLDAASLDEAGNFCITLCGTNLVFSGTDIYEHLCQAQQCALVAATLGAESERELRHYDVGSFDALAYGAACSALVEQVTDEAEAQVVRFAAERNLFTGTRYSPGYGNFSLEIHPKFLACLGAVERLGLRATDDNFLTPAKSVTAVIGLFDQPQIPRKSSCDSCAAKESCVIRAAGKTCYRA